METRKQKCYQCPFRSKAKPIEILTHTRISEMAQSGERTPICHIHRTLFCKGFSQFTEGSAGSGKRT